MKYLNWVSKSKVTKVIGLALIAAGLVSFAGLTQADTRYNLTVNVSDACGPVEAQVVVVNGPDDGAFGITTNGTYTFQGLYAGVFYLHITADGHNSYDTGAIVLTSDQTVNISLDRTNNEPCGGTTPTPTPGPTPPPGPVPPPPGPGDRFDLTVNVNDICGPVEAQIVIVNGPDDGAFGITTNGTYTFRDLYPGVFYLHITADNHQSKDTDAIVLTSDQTVNVTLVRTNGGCGPTTPAPSPFTIWGNCFGWPNPGVEVNFNRVANADTYTLQKRQGSASFANIATNLTFEQMDQFTDTNVSGGQTYEYRVIANGPGGSTTSSNTFVITVSGPNCGEVIVPPTPGTLTVTKDVRNLTSGTIGYTDSVSAQPGERVQFRIQLTSQNGALTNVVLTDALPSRLNYITDTLTVDGAGAGNSLSNINLGSFSSSQTKTVLLQATVAATAQFPAGTTTLTNTASATSSNNSASDSASVSVTVIPAQGTLEILKLVRNVSQGQASFGTTTSARPGEQVEFQIRVSALGSAVNNIVVNDELPTRLGYVNNSLTIDGSPSGNNLTNINVGTVAGSQTKTIAFRATVASAGQFPVGTTPLINIARATSDSNNAESRATVNVNNIAIENGELRIVKLVRNVSQGQSNFTDSAIASPGDTVQFQLQVTNTGSGSVANVSVVDTLPSDLTLVSGSSTTFNLGTLNSGSTQTVTLSAQVAGENNFPCGTSTRINNATASGTAVNSVSDSASVSINRSNNCGPSNASLSITKEVRNLTTNTSFGSSTTARSGEQVQFRIVVRNTGSQNANNVRVTDFLPAGLVYVNGSFQMDAGNGGGNLFSGGQFLGTLFPGNVRTIHFTATANSPSNISQTLTNQVQAAADNAPTVSANASVFVSTVQGGNIDLHLSKRAFNQTRNVDATTVAARPGDVIVYTLRVTNNGNAAATNYVFEDDIRDILQLARLDDFSDGSFDMANLVLRWNPVTIPAGGSIEKTFRVVVNSSFPAGSDNVMTNIFGNTVNVTVQKPAVLGNFIAPKTGSTLTTSLILSVLSFAGFLGFRKRNELRNLIAR